MGEEDFGGSLEDLSNGSDNFWGFGGYKNTVKRITTGGKLCDELKSLLEERYALWTFLHPQHLDLPLHLHTSHSVIHKLRLLWSQLAVEGPVQGFMYSYM